jgi:hypothetical protein
MVDKRKQVYCKIVAKKAYALYSLWGNKRGLSKKLVNKASEYALDKRLKTDKAFRFSVIVFAYALSLRLEKYYHNFFRKLFYLFAFLRERNALKMLKRVLGFYNDTDIREIIEVEMDKLSVTISNRANQDTTGGGKHSEMSELSFEEELGNFFEKVKEESSQNKFENHLSPDKMDTLKTQDDVTPVKSIETEREKISANETEVFNKTDEEKKTISKEAKEQDLSKNEPEKTEVVESKKEECPTQKSATNTSILAETLILEQEREQTHSSPFPVFRETDDDKFSIKKETVATCKEQEEKSIATEKDGNADSRLHSEDEREKCLFPVFSKEKEMGSGRENSITGNMEISEENKARIALNSALSDEQRLAIVMQLKEAAKIVMEKEERAWREKISVAEGHALIQSQSKTVQSSQNNETSIQAPKK